MSGFNKQKLINTDSFLYSSNWRTELQGSGKIAPNALLRSVLNCDVGVPSHLTSKITQFSSDEEDNLAKKKLLDSLSKLVQNKRRFNVSHHVKEAFKRNGIAFPDKLCEDAVPLKVVLTYISNALAKILPQGIVGNNVKQLQKLARDLLKGKPIVTVGHVVSYLHKGTCKVGWLGLVPDGALRSYLAASVAVWIATKLTPELIKAAFYGCKHDATKVPVFFTKPCWQSRTERALSTLVKDGYLRQVPLAASSKLPVLKFVPKDKGVRCILQYQKRRNVFKKIDKEQSIIIACKEFMNNIVGHSGNLSEDWITFRNNYFEQKKNSESEPILYYVYTDLSNAFSNVHQEIVFKIFKENLQRQPSTLKLSSRNHYTGYSLDLQTLKTLKGLFKINKSVITNRPEMEGVVKGVVWEQKAVFGRKRIFQVVKGIGQGHVLTNSLCNLALHHFYQNHLANFNQPDSHSILLRTSDDFLLLSLNKDVAYRFVSEFQEKAAGYGWTVNPAKIKQNLENPDLKWINFNGCSYDLKTMEVHPNFTKFTMREILMKTLRKPNPGDLDKIEMFWEVVTPLRLLKLQPLLFSCPDQDRSAIIAKVAAVGQLQAKRLVAGFSTFGLNSATLRAATKLLEALAALVLLWMQRSPEQCLRLVEVNWLMLSLLELRLRSASDLPVRFKMHLRRKVRFVGRRIKPEDLAQLLPALKAKV
ncbi:Hypothetical predicted protein [Cloeon dipterum]|uniref:Telomerase reverse transcriptase n=1 Tax=Cloeon dipterum TaxID=197152 RepID=A0A8S1DV25_9INSE|nr:Hypothetical predicted protein [Cloeon dipterum]